MDYLINLRDGYRALADTIDEILVLQVNGVIPPEKRPRAYALLARLQLEMIGLTALMTGSEGE